MISPVISSPLIWLVERHPESAYISHTRIGTFHFLVRNHYDSSVSDIISGHAEQMRAEVSINSEKGILHSKKSRLRSRARIWESLLVNTLTIVYRWEASLRNVETNE